MRTAPRFERTRFLTAVGLAAAAMVLVCPALEAGSGAAVATLHRAKLLTHSDLGRGWTPIAPNGSPAVNDSCLRFLKTSFPHDTHQSVAYQYGADFPVASVQEDVAVGLGTAARFAGMAAALSTCQQGPLTLNGHTFHATFSGVPFPTVGTQSTGYHLVLRDGGVTYRIDAVLFETGVVLGDVIYVNLDRADNGQLEAFAAKALAKL
jgi:hypothetical protein